MDPDRKFRLKRSDDRQALRVWLCCAAALSAVSLLVYGRVLRGVYLSDDFLYIAWWRDGFLTLLRKVTIDSYPRMIRPLPAIMWGLSDVAGGYVALHVLSLLVHAINGSLVAFLVWH